MKRRFAAATAKRLVVMALQVIAVITIVFILVRVFLESPARALAGQNQSPEAIRAIEERLGLNESLPVQYWTYIKSVLTGDLGDAFSTGNPVLTDLVERVPATLFLITVTLVIAGLLALAISFAVTSRPDGWIARLANGYGFVAGALPDFWVGLALIFVFYFQLDAVPAPAGQLDPIYLIDGVTNIAVIDTLLAGDMEAFSDAFGHLILPVVTLVLVYMGPIVRLTAGEAHGALNRDFVQFGRVLGLNRRRITWYALRQALPTFVTIVGTTYGFLLGGAVLVETVFSWGGAGQYAVSAVAQSDYAALQGFVIVAGIFTALVYGLVELMYYVVEPRARAS
jgi:ABC-type dipeptide/oligopeptide/nickel transport system permease component